MLTMNKKNISDINAGKKTATLRPLKSNGVYFKKNSIQMIKKGLFDPFYYFRVKLVNVSFVDINKLTNEDFKALGYTKEEYLREGFNINNNSSLRVKYDFKVIESNDIKIKELLGD